MFLENGLYHNMPQREAVCSVEKRELKKIDVCIFIYFSVTVDPNSVRANFILYLKYLES